MVGDSEVYVRAIVNPTLIIVQVDGGPDIVITDQNSTQILDGVKVFAGQGKSSLGNRLAFEAHKSIPIYRVEEKVKVA
jgi:hypothetical protein